MHFSQLPKVEPLIRSKQQWSGDDGSLIKRQLVGGGGVKWESHTRPTKNRFPNLAPMTV
jgi:hypothetical protein